jgi:hypothetical protein
MTAPCWIRFQTSHDGTLLNKISDLESIVSEWLLFNVKWAIFQLYHGENKLAKSWREQVTFYEMIIMLSLYQTNKLSWIFIVLAHCNNSPRLDRSLRSDTLFRFRANKCTLSHECFLLQAVKQHNPNFTVFCLTRPGLEPTINRTRGEHASHYTIDAVLKCIRLVVVTTYSKNVVWSNFLYADWSYTKTEFYLSHRQLLYQREKWESNLHW